MRNCASPLPSLIRSLPTAASAHCQPGESWLAYKKERLEKGMNWKGEKKVGGEEQFAINAGGTY